MGPRVAFTASLFVAALSVGAVARAGGVFPPWTGANDIPVPRWAKSVAPHGDETPVFRLPDRSQPRRGSLGRSARPPLYGAARGPGCGGRWLLVGPAAWACSDDVELAADDPPPLAPRADLPSPSSDDGLAFHHAFVGPEGASGFRDPEHAEEETPEADLDPGFAVAIVDEVTVRGERWARTRHGLWVALRELNLVRPLTLQGAAVGDGGAVDVAWVLVDRAPAYSEPKLSKPSGVHMRFERVRWREERAAAGGALVRVSDDGAAPEWMRARDLAHPTVADPPEEVGGKEARARWIDVDLATQTLLAYDGARPVYAALVSTGRGPQGSETATPVGVHRIWAKLAASTMSNLGDEEAESRYSIEDVPYVQFFAKGVALHGAFWHHSFGARHSHGCVNLAPVDARWLFEFTAPQMPEGWTAVLPAGATDMGTVVRVR